MSNEKLNETEMKDLLFMLQANHEMMMGCIEKWHEVHCKYMAKLETQFYPDKFCNSNISMSELTEMYCKDFNEGLK